ncbi:MAG: caspase family protein [Saprospiraceae bacterium]|nr:caspase family protein [Saprospiraceae bacterium]
MAKNVYALLVGVNAYEPPVPRLKGCVADVEAVQAYLKAMPGIRLHDVLLRDGEATKANIIDQFLSHLGQAGPDDVALFYFSGHGTREAANPVFWKSSPSRALQCLVPYNGIIAPSPPPPLSPSRLLADKELRFLIHQISKKQPHIITIFDCCHSGQNTRSGTDEVMARGSTAYCLSAIGRILFW